MNKEEHQVEYKKLFLLLILGIALISMVSASEIPVTQYYTQVTGSPYAGLGGVRITFNQTVNLFALEINATSNGVTNNITDAWVCTGMAGNYCNATIIGHATFGGTPFANFSSPITLNPGGGGYLFLVNTTNGPIQRPQNTSDAPPHPILVGNVNDTVDPSNQAEGLTGWMVDIKSLFDSAPPSSTFSNQSYSSSVLTGSTNPFSVYINETGGSVVTVGTLYYNGTPYNTQISSGGNGIYLINKSITAPQVSVNTAIPFYWNITLANGTYINSSSTNQQVTVLGIDNCSVNTIQIMNLTLVDEDQQFWLTNQSAYNTSIKVDLSLYSDAAQTNLAVHYSHFYNQTNPARACISTALGNAIYYETTQIEYTANNYADEFYNIQNYQLNATSNPSENITLYDLLSSRDQIFVITYKDGSFLPVPGALIQISRKYVDEGLFKTIEVPVTNPSGATAANLVLNSVVYTFTVTKNGQTLAVFPNYLAQCQNPLISTCEIDLTSFTSSLSLSNFTSSNDFAYTLTYDKTTRLVTSNFNIPSGAAHYITLNVSMEDAIGTSACTNSVTTSSGSLTCTIPTSLGNATAVAYLYKDGTLVAFGQINLGQTPQQIYGGTLVLLSVVIFLTLLGAGLSDSPVYTVIFMVVGVVLLTALNMIGHTGFIGGTATILLLVLGALILIIKGGNRNP